MGDGGVSGGLAGPVPVWGIGSEVGSASGAGILAILGCESSDRVAEEEAKSSAFQFG